MRFLSSTLAAAVISLFSTATLAMPIFPSALSGNTTGAPDSVFLGAPDDTFVGLGGQTVTYDFGATTRVLDIAGADLNVYEVDFGLVEFSSVTVSVSLNGMSFVNAALVGPAVPVPGDGAHNNPSFRRGYDISGTGLSEIRFVRIDGNGTGAAGGVNGTSGGTPGFDLDAIVGLQTRVVSASEPGILALMGLGLIGLVARRRKA